MTPSAAGALGRKELPNPGLSGSKSAALQPGMNSLPDLQSRINQMQSSRLNSRRLPTVPALAKILPGGGLQSGGSYAVRNSTTLAMALLAGPSATGAWCSVVGLPEFSVEAAEEFGINLERLILIPDPGSQWLTVTAALVDVVSVVLTRAPAHLAPSDTARLKSRLRQRGTALITLGNWQQCDSTLSIAESAWEGLGSGTGHLQARRMKITATNPAGRLRHTYVGLTELQRGPWQTSGDTALEHPPTSDDGTTLFQPTRKSS
ncbi:hypothetical protein IWX65_001560 [Arthrobacter sp. CAN_A214]